MSNLLFETYGPLNLPMPDDSAYCPWLQPESVEIVKASRAGQSAIHEDGEDRLNADGTWGPPDNLGAPGGSGIVFGHSLPEFSVVKIAAIACYKRAQWYDLEHFIRQIRYAVAAYEFALKAGLNTDRWRALLSVYGQYILAKFPIDGPVHEEPDWDPFTIPQLNMWANLFRGQGLPGWNLRQMGWCAYTVAMAMKANCAIANSDLWSRCNTWGLALVESLELAANPETGQLTRDWHEGIDQTDVQYTFHWAILAHGIMALCAQMDIPIPPWIEVGMDQLKNLHGEFTYPDPGSPAAPPAFVRSVGGVLVPATGPAQAGDPAHGWWSTNCVALGSFGGSEKWEAASVLELYGPTPAQFEVSRDEQTRKQTQVHRGFIIANS